MPRYCFYNLEIESNTNPRWIEMTFQTYAEMKLREKDWEVNHEDLQDANFKRFETIGDLYYHLSKKYYFFECDLELTTGDSMSLDFMDEDDRDLFFWLEAGEFDDGMEYTLEWRIAHKDEKGWYWEIYLK